MKKSIIKNSIITLSVITALLLSGCNSDSASTNNNSTKDPMDTGHIETSFTDSDGNIFVSINADVIGDDSQVLPVATVKRHDIDSDDIKTMADNIFDNSEYYNKRSIGEYSIEELNAFISEQESLKDIICTSDKFTPDEGQVITGSFNYTEYNKDLDYYKSFISSANQESSLTSDTNYTFNQKWSSIYDYDIDTCNLIGTYNNLPCEMLFQRYDNTMCGATNLTISIDASNQLAWGDYTLSQLEYTTMSSNASHYYDISTSTDNQCKYTIDEAILLCDNMIKQLGINDMSAARYTNLITKAYSVPLSDYFTLNTIENTANCGYKIFYEKSINGINTYTQPKFDDSYFSPLLALDGDEYVGTYGDECLIFTVFDCGIITVEYGNPTEMADVTSYNAPLLDFNDVISIADIAFNENYVNNFNTTNPLINISKIELTFMRVKDSQNPDTYSLIPVWNFIDKNSSRIKISLNAIDGSILEVEDYGIS